jgi:D-arabinose 5-phosphate isomerase GutQ
MKTAAWDQFREAFRIEAEALRVMGGFILEKKESFNCAVAALMSAPRIAASGCGHTGIACQHFTHLMCCIERPARFISPAEAVHGAAGFLQKGDLMLLASRGGKTSELLPILEICKGKGVIVIGLTENASSPLALESDIFLPLKITREVDKYNCQGTTSFIIMCAIFDALQAALIEEISFQNESFALVHPGGAVGERLREKS